MNKEKFVFAQLVEFLNADKFRHIVNKYQGNRYIKSFTCWNQLQILMFGQLDGCNSLRELTDFTTDHANKSFHLGFGRTPINQTQSTGVNQLRDYHVFEEVAYHTW